MTDEWDVAKGSGRCAVSGREFAEGEPYFAVLVQGEQGLERRDYSVEAWTGPPEGCFCYWRGHVPVREKKSATLSVDQELLTHLFLRLEDEESEMHQQFRFVLALLLMRKRLLKYEQSTRDGEREYWQLRLASDQSVHQVINPQLTNEQVDRLGAQLLAILSGQPGAVAALDAAAEAAAAPAGESEDHVART